MMSSRLADHAANQAARWLLDAGGDGLAGKV
jgi:hypothetical protein